MSTATITTQYWQLHIPEIAMQYLRNEPHWQVMLANLNKMGVEELAVRKQELERFLNENGVTYHIYNQHQGANRIWALDPVPYLISATQWQNIEAGLSQRATLLNLLLQDIYGEQRLLKAGVLPKEIILGHKGYMRQCVGINHANATHLTLYSANLAHGSNGKFWVINDRVQAPSGTGYALENRMAITRLAPELFNGLKVSRLGPFFKQLDASLQQIAPNPTGQARIVILTPGPGNETYFEHSYLSSYLGYTLVQGSDLMVKDRYVWLKTIGGLEKVDVILRRVDDWYCDPLELKEDSLLGVPGLLQAVRDGHVAIANPLGIGVLENPGLMPFMDSISQYFLQQPLLMPNIASWWCGQAKECQYVLDNLQHLVIKKIHRTSLQSSSIDGSTLSIKARAAFKASILANPWLYVGQEKVSFAHSPTFDDNKIGSRNALCRLFLVNNGQGYEAMKGGLSSTASENNSFLISNQLGGNSKDTWVLAPESNVAPKTITEKFDDSLPVKASMLPSHTAENLLWVGRYAERLLGTTRLMRTVLQFVTDGQRLFHEAHIVQSELQLLQILTQYMGTLPGFCQDKYTASYKDPWPELLDMVTNTQRAGSLSYNLQSFIRSVHSVRDHWSTDTWRVIKNLQFLWQNVQPGAVINRKKILHNLDETITGLVAFIGLSRESISREQGWIMLDMGRKFEQCSLSISLLKAAFTQQHPEQVSYIIQEAVLKSQEALINYRYKNRTHLQLGLVLELLILDKTHPRSLEFQVDRLMKWLQALPMKTTDNQLSIQELKLQHAQQLLQQIDIQKLIVVNKKTKQLHNLTNLLQQLQSLLIDTTVAVSNEYFLHAVQAKQLFTAKG